jgi:hypothetical protein
MADTLTREDVKALVGPTDDLMLAAILASGATAGELAEAAAWVENDEAMLNAGRPIPTGRVGQLVEILKTKDDEEFLAEPEP